ncbi:hypothetical protein DFQ27_009316 [Actinomortierella ambigua]|uniref:Uncharacterized protein n=1 Tax=Actinomortierella ambigua TaxID=1343610 RepID=A0A9P6PNG4_9FUNG|nr:hypothetical protein DFQ27_009316 [Actinomortierella ambigua]
MPEQSGPLQYQPSDAGNIAFGVVYAILGLVFSYYTYRHKNKWAICLPTAAFASSIGFFCRTAIDTKDLNVGLFVVQNILIIATPSAFLAFNYMLYGRLITAIDPQFGASGSKSRMEKSRYSAIPPRIVSRVFIGSDITTFLIQVVAGSIMGSAGDEDESLANIGDKLFLVGVCAQGATYSLFTVLLTVALARLIVFLFVLDAVPLVLAIGIWAIFWPPILFERITTHVREGMYGYYMKDSNADLRTPSNESSRQSEFA